MTARDEIQEVIGRIADLCGHGQPVARADTPKDAGGVEKDLGSLSIEEIIRILSEMHKNKSTDPEVLAGSTFHDFDRQHERFEELFSLQPLLFGKCKERGDGWTR
jgi:hypothetical protein